MMYWRIFLNYFNNFLIGLPYRPIISKQCFVCEQNIKHLSMPKNVYFDVCISVLFVCLICNKKKIFPNRLSFVISFVQNWKVILFCTTPRNQKWFYYTAMCFVNASIWYKSVKLVLAFSINFCSHL